MTHVGLSDHLGILLVTKATLDHSELAERSLPSSASEKLHLPLTFTVASLWAYSQGLLPEELSNILNSKG